MYGSSLDISRLEGIIKSGKPNDGYAILLTNNHLFRNSPYKPDGNNADFVLHHDREITGTMRWDLLTSAETLKDKKTQIDIRGQHKADWREFPALQERGTLGSGTC